MSKLKHKPIWLKGSAPAIVNGNAIAVVGQAVNQNADVLEELITKVEDLEKQIEDMRLQNGE